MSLIKKDIYKCLFYFTTPNNTNINTLNAYLNFTLNFSKNSYDATNLSTILTKKLSLCFGILGLIGNICDSMIFSSNLVNLKNLYLGNQNLQQPICFQGHLLYMI